MNIQPMIIDRKFLLFVAVLSFILLLTGSWLKITHVTFGTVTPHLMLTVAIIPGIFAWLIVFYDIIKHSFRNSLLWIIGMFCFGSVVTILYLLQRDHLVGRK